MTEWEYVLAHSSPQDEVLAALERETHLKNLSPQMMSGSYQGKLLELISKMLQPLRILEIGTFTGYASICLARGLRPSGLLHTIEVNDELAWYLRKYATLAGLSDKIVQHLGDAGKVIPTLDETFDLVFMDAGKLDYSKHYALAMEKLRPGGVLLADNILWYGKVAAEESDLTTVALREFNTLVQDDPRVENILLPIRDGLTLIRKLD